MVPSPPAPRTGVLGGGLQPQRPVPAPRLQLILHVSSEGHPVGDLGGVEDHRRPRPPLRLRPGGLGADHLGDQLVANRHLDTGREQRDRGDQRAEQRAAEDVGEVVSAQDPAVDRDSQDQQYRADLPAEPGAEALPGDRERGTDRDACGRHAAHVTGGIGVASGRDHVQGDRGPRPVEAELEQLGAAPAPDDDHDQRHRELAKSAPECPPGDAGNRRVRHARPGDQGDGRGDLRGRRAGIQGRGNPALVQCAHRVRGEGQRGPADKGHQQRDRDQDRGPSRRSADHSLPIMAPQTRRWCHSPVATLAR
jgi:hypothetical protein